MHQDRLWNANYWKVMVAIVHVLGVALFFAATRSNFLHHRLRCHPTSLFTPPAADQWIYLIVSTCLAT